MSDELLREKLGLLEIINSNLEDDLDDAEAEISKLTIALVRINEIIDEEHSLGGFK